MTDTYTLAFEACGQYFASTGKIPTVEALKAEIGRKSPSVISAAIKAWKAELAQTIDKRQAGLTDIPAELNDAFIALWHQALESAMQVYRDREQDLEGKEAALTLQIHEVNTERARVEQLIESNTQHHRAEIEYLKQAIDQLTQENARLKAEHVVLQDQAAQSDRQSAIYQEQLRQEHDQYQRLELRFDKQNEWALQRIHEEKELYQQQIQQEMKRLTSEAARDKQDLVYLQTKADRLTEQVIAGQAHIIEMEQTLTAAKLNLIKDKNSHLQTKKSIKGLIAERKAKHQNKP